MHNSILKDAIKLIPDKDKKELENQDHKDTL